ncbi:MAG TPA: magnesium transporter [Solirubrobacterales bacterium]
MNSTVSEPTPGPGPGLVSDRATWGVPTASAPEPAGEVRKRIIGREFECAEEVVVLDDERLVGLVSIERLLAAAPEAPLEEIMDPNPPVAAPDANQELAAHRMLAHEESSLALVDDRGRFRGLVPPRAMLDVLFEEHAEDLARLGGYLAGSSRARLAAEEPVKRRLIHRLPWLLIGLAGAMSSAVLVGAFEDELSTNVLLAFFLPGLVYMADAVGTQTETVLIRAMAAGVSPRAVLARELLTGLIVGVIIGAVFVAFALAGWGDADVALAVGVALFASCSIATLVAIALPALIHHFGGDPAFGSGPLATVIQDLLSIAVYFAIVVVFVS